MERSNITNPKNGWRLASCDEAEAGEVQLLEYFDAGEECQLSDGRLVVMDSPSGSVGLVVRTDEESDHLRFVVGILDEGEGFFTMCM